MNDSSFGNAAPKSRSINVGANLLGEWIDERARLRREVARYAALFCASTVVGAAAFPCLWRAGDESSRRAKTLKGESASLDSRLVQSDKARKAAQPALIVDGMSARTKTSFAFFVSQLDSVLRAGNARTAISGVRCEVQAGEAHAAVQALAEDESAADAYARRAAEAGAKVDAITNSRPSALLGPSGISFEYEKRMAVGK